MAGNRRGCRPLNVGARVWEGRAKVGRVQESMIATYAARPEQLPVQGQWTYDDYALLPDDGKRYEVIRAEIYTSAPPRPLHQRVIFRLSYFLEAFLEERSSGIAFSAPIDVLLPEKLGDPVQPDILFVRSDRIHIIGETYIEGAPDLVMEVLSPSNPSHDRSLKYQLYEEAGVLEYWIIDPRERTIEIHVLRDGSYILLGRFGEDESARSELLEGFAVIVGELIPA